MYLKRLEIHGFKSFPDRTSLSFGSGVSAVVGPNGSGKSNITEAVRWTLGEQSPKSLRGSKMEDIIFAGTERRRPLGMAEVTLTLDNSDGTLPIDFTEVTVTRRVDRSGEGDYLINGVACRLKDIHDLFADTGIGREGYFIIGQGKIDEILSHRPEDRRGLFEEAAGIVKYKNRKREASKKLEETESALLRVGDVLAELDGQVESLAAQAQTAAWYQELSSELEGLEVAGLVAEIDRSEALLAAAQERIAAYSDRSAALSAEIASAEAEQESDRLKLADLDGEVSTRQSQLLALTAERSKLQGSIDLAGEKAGGAGRDAGRVLGEVEGLRQKQAGLESQLSGLGHRVDEIAAERQRVLEELDRSERGTALMAEEIALGGEALEREKGRLVDLNRRLADKQGWLGSGEKGREEVQERLERARHERRMALDSRAREDQELAAVRAEVEHLEAELTGLKSRAAEAAAEQERLLAQLAGLDARERKLQQELAATQSRVRVLDEMHRDHEGLGRGVKALIQGAEKDPDLGRGVCGVVAELVKVDKKFELAIETALGGAWQNIVSQTDKDAQRCIEWLKATGAGRVTFLPLNTLRPNLLRPEEVRGMDAAGVVGPAIELVSFDERYRPAMTFLLGRTLVCRDLKSGVAVGKSNEFRFRVVTLEGDQLNPGGSLTGGAPASKGSGILGRERERDEARVALEGLRREAEAVVGEAASRRERLNGLEDSLRTKREEYHRLELTLAGREKDRARHFEERTRWDETANRIDLEEVELAARLSGGARMHEQWAREISLIEREIKELEQRIEAEAGRLAGQSREREGLIGLATTLKVRLAALDQEEAGLLSEEKRCRTNGAELADLVSLKLAEVERLKSGAEYYQREINELESELDGVSGRLEVLEAELQTKTSGRQDLMAATARRERDLRGLHRAESEANEALAAARREETRSVVEIEGARRRLAEDHGLELEPARLKAAAVPAPDDSRARESELRREIDDLGQVNLGAIEEYRRVVERRDFLGQQRSDLGEAKESLYRVIAELDERIKTRFMSTFQAIRQEFAQSFSTFFGGGRADLQLVEDGDLLEAGIEIVAQPPGKKLQSLSLLSGGERALTAIALLFAMLKVKTVPFVVLDEIEAALDETNVDRFARVLKDYGQRSQFIVVTHQKGTMAAADVLYGVTMEEQGVSRMVSVRLTGGDQAKQELAS